MGVASLGFVACKKDDAKINLSGTWEGNWGFGTDVPSFYEKWSLEQNGGLSSYYPDGSLYAKGTWELNGDDFEAHYKPLGDTYTYSFTGTYDDGVKEINGDWKELQDPTNGGTFAMYKQ